MKKYSDSTLTAMTKTELISYIRILEHNLDCKEETISVQYNLLERITKNMSIEKILKTEVVE